MSAEAPPPICRPPATTEEWAQYFDLRWRVLREPWKQPRGSERDELEDSADHLAIFHDGVAAAAGRLHEIERDLGQIRYMAVALNHARQGFGSTILQGLEAIARKKHYAAIELDARESALKFYEHHGYETISSLPPKWGISHQRMRKSL